MQIENDPYSPSLIANDTSHPLAKERRTFLSGLEDLLRRFSPAERLALYVFSLALALSAFILVGSANDLISMQVPTEGGAIVEGAIGTPRFANPLLAATQADEDLTMLTYSGLLRAIDGSFEPDLASSYEISDDGTIYTFRLREGLTFHDGTPLTADDVLFTVALAQDPNIKSPRRADWDGVSATAPDDRTLVFTLPHPYAPFLENATLGILPKEHWENVPAEEFPFSTLNTHPIGSGPYAVRSVEFDATGAPTEYDLRAFEEFALGEPHLSRVTYRVYANEEDMLAAFEEGDVTSFVASSPKNTARDIQESGQFVRIPLTRVFGVFFNQNHAPVLADAAARSALNAAIDKKMLIEQVLGGYGEVLDGPVAKNLFSGGEVAGTSTPVDAEAFGSERAREILRAGGWRYVEATATTTEGHWSKGTATLSLTLATPDTEDLVASAEAVATAWRAAGVKVAVEVYPLSEFNQTVLRPRAYDAILFGEVVGRSLDLYPFWHSSQRNDPGLNFSLYTNSEADRALAAARESVPREARETSIREFLAQIKEDSPAVFLYSPELAYLLPAHIKGVAIDPIMSSGERFTEIHTWYRDTERVWDFFSTR